MKFKSVATKNKWILILSLTPFIIGLIFSIYKSSDTEYLSAAINISGSQRMRTMLLSNYSQQFYLAKLKGDEENAGRVADILDEESHIYERYYYGLIGGDASAMMKANPFDDIRGHLQNIEPLVTQYLYSVEALLENPMDEEALAFITGHAMEIKDHFHEITDAYQETNDRIIFLTKSIDIIMLIFATTVTIFGLFLTSVIKKHEHQAKYDQLTNLKNRHSFYEFTISEKAEKFHMLFMDINAFKHINDLFGHDIGDEVLIAVAGRLEEVLPPGSLYRYGGDEFLAIICQKQLEKRRKDLLKNEKSILCSEMVDDIQNAFKRPITDSKGNRHEVELSIGGISKDVGIKDWDIMVSLSDKLMYESKHVGRNITLCRTKDELSRVLQEIKNEVQIG